jgi:hypothetical protein
MFPLVVVLSVHVSFGRCIVTWTGNTTTKGNMDRQYNHQKKHGQTIQQPNETCKKHGQGNTTTKRNMDRQYNDLLVVVLSVHVSFGRCIVYPCFFWSLYCLNMDRQYKDQKKHGQGI